MSESVPSRLRGLCHIGIHSKDPEGLAAFYRDVLGMSIVGGSTAENEFVGASAFLSSRPGEESHEIVIFANPDFRHAAFKVGTVADLRDSFRDISGRGVAIRMALNHGVSLAFYFNDPEGNMIEVYWPTGLDFGQPYGHPIDLTQTDEALLRDVEELAARQGLSWSAASASA